MSNGLVCQRQNKMVEVLKKYLMRTKVNQNMTTETNLKALYILAYMATSGGHFSRPLELVSICDSLNNSEGMTIFGRNDTNPEGMTIIRKE
jgi:hypothetical protein